MADEDPKNYTPTAPGRAFYVLWSVAVLVLIGLTAGLVLARGIFLNHQTATLEEKLEAGPRVVVEPVITAPTRRTVELPGTVRGYLETPVYAKIPGYLKQIYVDKGDRVAKNQVIAVLVSPELDQQVKNALASFQIAELTDRRNQALLSQGVIATQTADESRAAMLEARATYAQLVETQQYKVIRAPFAAMVAARYVDPGQLIPQVTTPTTANTAIVLLATLTPLRIYADVPQTFAPFVHDGDAATVTVSEYPGREFAGSVTRHPEALTAATRTMLTEVDLPNRDRALFPGMYATIRFQISTAGGAPLVPDDALIFRDGKPYVPVVRANRLRLMPVTLGYDDGVNSEITRGITPQDVVALNVGQSARDGEVVRPITAAEANQQ